MIDLEKLWKCFLNPDKKVSKKSLKLWNKFIKNGSK